MISLRKRRVSFRHIGGFAGALFVFGLMFGTVLVPHVFAQVDIGPNSDWFGGQDQVRYVLEEDGNVTGAGNLKIPIYVFNGSTTNQPSINVTANNASSGFSGSLAAACLTLTATGGCGSGAWCQMDCVMNIPASSFTYDNTIGGWTTLIGAHLMQPGIHEFNLTASNGATIGYYASKQAGDRSFAVAHTYTAGNRYEYVIPFGSDCSVTGPTPANAIIFDGDVGNAGIQPLPFRVRIIDNTAGTTIVDQFYSTVGQANAAGLGNFGTATYGFTALPNHKYQFVLDNVASHNTLQFQLPYSSIYAQTSCHYALTPTTTVSPDTSEANALVTVNPAVSNNGSISSASTQWQLSRFVVPAGQAVPAGGTSGQAPAPFYGHGLTSLGSGNGQFYPPGVTNLVPTTDDLGSQPVGTKVCYALSVKAVSDTDGSWAHGQPSCVTIAKKPKVQVWGGDLNAGAPLTGGAAVSSKISTSVSQQVGKVYGSWAEYAITATGTITGIGSGSAYQGGLANYNVCNVSQLIFTSAGNSSCTPTTVIGNYSSTQPIPDVGAAFPTSASTPGFSGIGDTAQRRVETASGTVNVGGGTVNKGDWLVLNAPTATVNITGDINYTSGQLANLYDIPQVIIIANCINIAGGVHNVDAWLIAVGKPGTNTACSGVADGGVINTCSDVPVGGDLSSTVCGNTLRVNGPTMARHLFMQRTAGAGPAAQAGDPAETFNLRPDAYLWLAQRSITAGFIQAVSTTELPPRF